MPTAGNAPSCAPAEAIRLEGVSCLRGPVLALDGVSLAVPAGAFVSILGPSGCGKSTLLGVVAGHIAPAAGRVLLGGAEAKALAPEARGIGMVFQNLALFPHLSAIDNVAFGPRARGAGAAEALGRARAMLARVGIGGDEAARRPDGLSGGQRQRVALARALVTRPAALLLDEPLSGLDTHLRSQMLELVLRLHKETGIATLMVTHDPAEAMAHGDILAVMNRGKVVESGPPRRLYDAPRSEFTAGFLGPANIVDAAVAGLPGSGRVLVRPEHLEINPSGAAFSRPMVVARLEYHGHEMLATLADGPLRWVARGRGFPPVGTAVVAGASRVHLLETGGSP